MSQVTDNHQGATTVPPRAGDPAPGLDRLMVVAYQELRQIAHRRMQGERSGHTLQTTALVNEAYLRLRELRHIDWQDRPRFLAVAAGTMRRILVDQARAFRADKRGGDVLRVTLDEQIPGDDSAVDLLALDAALTRLCAFDVDIARVVELRYFGGLGVAETGEALGLSPATVKRKWALAQAWLYRELHPRA